MSAVLDTMPGAARQFVTFQVQDELFGVPLAEVQEIIRVPELVKVPMCPASLVGIGNLRGSVLPVNSLRLLFGEAEASHDDATRVVVVHHAGAPVGFVVDRMANVITAEPEEIEGTEALETTIRSEWVRGVVKRRDGMVLLLDPARLTRIDGREPERRIGSAALAGNGTDAAAVRRETTAIDEIQLVSFEAAGQEYAFPIADVQEILQVPERLVQVPQSAPQVVGVMTMRQRLLPLVSLRRLFGLPEATIDDRSRILIVAVNGDEAAAVGIVLDTVKEVLRVSRSFVDPIPALLKGSDEGDEGAFEAICRLDGGKRLVTVLSVARMFGDAALRGALAAAVGADAPQDKDEAQATMTDGDGDDRRYSEVDDDEQVVIFRLAGEEYGVPIDCVQEIVRVPAELARLPKAAEFMEGVINLRGTVLPVVDQRRRFALAECERNDRQRIMVLSISGVRTGFIVDQVLEVLKLARGAIEPAPALSEEQARLIRRVANLAEQHRMILLLDPANLLHGDEIAALEAA